MTPETLKGVLAARAGGKTVTLATRLSDGAQFMLPDAAAPAGVQEQAAAMVAAEDVRSVEIGGESWFLQVEAPAPRLLIVGAVHIAQALAPMAAMCGYAPTVIDPRRGFATEARFPDTKLVIAWPDEAFVALAPDGRTAVVTLSHDPKIDDPALDAALRADIFFIGAAGVAQDARGPVGAAGGAGARAGGAGADPRAGGVGAWGADGSGNRAEHRFGVGGRRGGVATGGSRGVTAQEEGWGGCAIPPRPPVTRVAGVVLAAGLSRRMAPRNKLLVTDDSGVAMIARTVDAVLASRARPVCVVVGHQADDIIAVLADRPVTIVASPDYRDGMSASLRAGLRALPQDVAGALICLGDMPLVRAGDIDQVIEAYDPALGTLIVVPTHGGQRGNPVLWDRSFFAEMSRVQGDIGARALLARFCENVTEVVLATDGVLRDFDVGA